MCVGVMGTALISPLYPLYQQAWQLSASDVSVIYVIYMSGALVSLLFLGPALARYGFARMMQLSLLLTVIGSLASMLAPGLVSLNLARFIVGVASSMMTTSASLGLVALAGPGNARRAATQTSFLLAFGFGLGPLVGGIIGQWAPHPLVLTYIPTILLGLFGLYLLRRLSWDAPQPAPTSSQGAQWRQWLPRLTWAVPADRFAFLLTTCCPFLAFGVFGLNASMLPLFMEKMVPWHGPVVSGTAVAVILMISAVVQLMSGRLSPRWSGCWGLLTLALCCALLLVNLRLGSPLVFGACILATAIGHGMSMLAGIHMVNRIASGPQRGALLSTYMVVGYVGSMLPMLGIGKIADHWGLPLAVSLFCGAVIVLATLAALGFARHPRMAGH